LDILLTALGVVVALVLVIAVGVTGTILWRMLAPPHGKTVEEVVDQEVHKLRSAGRGDFAVVVGVYRNGQVWTKGYGRVSGSDPAPPTSATVFQIGSITKVFTAALLQLLSGREGLSEALPIRQLPGPALPLNEASAGLTLEQLATHTAGFARIPKFLERDLPMARGEKEVMKDPYRHLLPETVFAYLKQTEPDPQRRPPGRFEYSNYGMGLLGHLLAHATGQAYEHLLRREILETLEMHDTAVSPTPDMQSRLAQGHTVGGEPAAPWHFSALEGAGALLSTADDMMRFVRANLEAGTPLHAPLQAMHAPRASGKTGLGWLQPTFFDKLLGNKHLVWHDGGTLGYSSYLCVDRAAASAVLILCASGMGVSLPGMVLSRKLRTLRIAPSPSTRSSTRP
jgi:CubicO group peptidase (beta-lactamase class C family)